MKIGISGPISTESVKDLLDGDTSRLPKGYVGAPFLGTLIKTLIKNGHQVSAYTLDYTLPPEQLNPIIASGQNFKIYYCPLRKHSIRPNGRYLGRSLDFFYREIQALKNAILIDQPDIVHAHWSYEFALAAHYSQRPYLVTCHDSPLNVLKFMPGYYRFSRLLMALLVFIKVKHLTAVSPYVKNEIARFTKKNITVIPNPSPIAHDNNPLVNFEALDLTAPKIIMILNGWGILKNPKPAMLAFHQLFKSNQESTLHMFGADFQPDGPAQQWAKENNIDKNMVFHGPTTNAELLNFLNQATLLLHPSLEECCPMTLIEAMSVGLPVVGGEKSGGVPWVLDYGQAGILADVTKPDDMVEKMNTILDNKQLYFKLRRQAIHRINQLFSQDVVATAYETVYSNVLKGRL